MDPKTQNDQTQDTDLEQQEGELGGEKSITSDDSTTETNTGVTADDTTEE